MMVRHGRRHAAAAAAAAAAAVVAGVSPAFLHAQVPPAHCLSVEHVVDLGALADSASVQVPLEVDVAAAPWGGWLVTEDGNPVIEYAADGSFRRRFGRIGEGPEEMRAPIAVTVDPTDSVWISDNRGRAVVFTPQGRPARTVTDPTLFQVHGFTPSGNPFGIVSRITVDEANPVGWELARVWSREGELLDSLGPGALHSRGIVTYQATPPQSVAVDDTVLMVARGWTGWISRWTRSTQDTLAPASSIWHTLGLGNAPERWQDGYSVALTSDGDTFWVLGAVRRLSREREEALVEAAPRVGIERMSRFRRQSARVRNAVYDGALIRADRSGSVLRGVTFEEYPWGFLGRDRFYTFAEEPSGLVKIRIWRFRDACGAG